MGPIELLTLRWPWPPQHSCTVVGTRPESGQAVPVLHVCQDALQLSSGSEYIMISDADLRSVTNPNLSDLQAEKPTGNTVKVYNEINSLFAAWKAFSLNVISVVWCVSCVIELHPLHTWRAEDSFARSILSFHLHMGKMIPGCHVSVSKLQNTLANALLTPRT